MVYKHIAKDGARIKMNKLGGGEWSRTKQRVKAAAADMAKELIDLYAKRANTPGISFPKDDEWQSDFEAKFPFEETDDQLRSIQEMLSLIHILSILLRRICLILILIQFQNLTRFLKN